ncbi:hypothetical protein BCR35DRAFT_355220 [Leucosporidium creatinivorum]|uniref:Zn(2)-C6 fungal-type domain-containing protein n=1 Tax=Leucosporidium creatinivorum TaxID=106004 RepID=A0A1Y2DPG1_9BASI|nr:hypothetical protein BCR35DRAFT_355220 [Leucosporidium creatinivorum]
MDRPLAGYRRIRSRSPASKEGTPGGSIEGKTRKKVTLACGRCKRRKGKCDGVAPICGPCAAVGATCEIPDPTSDGRRRRGKSMTVTFASPTASSSRPRPDFEQHDTEQPSAQDCTSSSKSSLSDFSTSSFPLPSAQQPVVSLPPLSDSESLRTLSEENLQASTLDADTPCLHYFRPYGATALQSGIEPIEEIQLPVTAAPSFSRAQSPTGWTPFIEPRPSLFDESCPDVPRWEVMEELSLLFFARMGDQFPFLSMDTVRYMYNIARSPEQVEYLSAPLLLLGIAALGARFSPKYVPRGASPATSGTPFADKAKSLLLPLLAIPSGPTITCLLLLAHDAYGNNQEGLVWQYVGMALRQSVDLGMQLDVDRSKNKWERATSLILIHALLNLDYTISLTTGRCTTIKREEISVPPPNDEAMAVCRGGPDQTLPILPLVSPSAFCYYTKIMSIVGDLCDLVNRPTGTWGAQVPRPLDGEDRPSEDSSPDLMGIEEALNEVYENLPTSLQWSSSNFREQVSRGDGSMYLQLHLWYHGMIIILYRPPLLSHRCQAGSLSLAERLNVVSNSVSAIVKMLSCAEMVSSDVVTPAPYLHVPLFVAAQSSSQNWRIRTGYHLLSNGPTPATENPPPISSSNKLLAETALAHYEQCKAAIARIGALWLGAVPGITVLEKRGGLGKAMGAAMVSRHELAVFKRLAQRISGQGSTSGATPDMDTDYLLSLFSTIQEHGAESNVTSSNPMLSQDDFALAYTFASNWPESLDFRTQE